MRKMIVVLSLFMSLFAGAVHAAEWVIERATGDVSVSVDGQSWHSVVAGDAVPNAHWVRTGPRDRVILAKGTERIMYRENTLAAISVSQPSGKKTKVTHQRGSILLAVKKRRTQHTSVVTPHLAAVVKGTVFEVTVGQQQSNIRVDRGLVAVSDGTTTIDVPPGKQATAGRGNPSVTVTEATETSIGANGQVGLGLAEVKSNGKAGSKGNRGGNGRGKAGGLGNNAGGLGNNAGGLGSNAGGLGDNAGGLGDIAGLSGGNAGGQGGNAGDQGNNENGNGSNGVDLPIIVDVDLGVGGTGVGLGL